MPEASDPKKQNEKTQAKQRYLRRKKERRKHRSKTNAKVVEPSELDEEREEYGTYDIGSPLIENVLDKVTKAVGKRPIKRRKIVNDSLGASELQDTRVVAGDDIQRTSIEPPEVPQLQSQASLPSFPLPALPDAPSKSVLALQGLDRALIVAETVDSAILLPIPEGKGDGGTMLSEKTRKRLKDLGITELFAVQTCLLPFLLPQNPFERALYQPYNPPRDVCVSAPTGSGKTLAYVLPIIEVLSTRTVTRLRALVVLPTRDLVTQVRETFEVLSKGRGLKIGTATGHQSFSHEQSQLITDRSPHLKGGSSKIDVLICTPGRLVDHIHGTPNFSLQHLRFLVIDEADRLLAQSFQDWLLQVLAATQPSPRSGLDKTPTGADMLSLTFPDAVSPIFLETLPYPDIPVFPTEKRVSSCQKLLFSATLTRDPGKIAALDLRNPKYFVVQESEKEPQNADILGIAMERFSMPSTLIEHMIICDTLQKPLMFFYLLHMHKITNALVFTKSTESTTRLVRLFDFFEKARTRRAMAGTVQEIVVRAYSSDLLASHRKSILEKFRSQEIQILVCSDVISRGIDISHVSHVISYDAPVDIRKYVHRVGRTARAGRAGDAWTLVEEQEARYFKGILRQADHLEKVKKIKVGEKELAPMMPDYEAALEQLKEVYTR